MPSKSAKDRTIHFLIFDIFNVPMEILWYLHLKLFQEKTYRAKMECLNKDI